jgi:hypothetical protein
MIFVETQAQQDVLIQDQDSISTSSLTKSGEMKKA